MTARIINFAHRRAVQGLPMRKAGRPSISFAFRSYGKINEADEATLVRDVGCDLGKAQTKLKRIREAMESHSKRYAVLAGSLATAEAKLSAAIAKAASR